MQKALNEFLGRTIVDPTLRAQYQAGRIDEVLRECGFDAGAAERLSALKAPNFTAYLQQVYETVQAAERQGHRYRHPWPAAGLASAEAEPQSQGQAA